MRAVLWAFILFNLVGIYFYNKSHRIAQQIESSITNSTEAMILIEESQKKQRALALTSLGFLIDEPALLGKAKSEVVNDGNSSFAIELNYVLEKNQKTKGVNKTDMLNLASKAEEAYVNSLNKKADNWKEANSDFVDIISSYKTNSNLLFAMQVLTLLSLFVLVLFKRSQDKIKAKMRKQEQLQSKLFSSLSEGVFLCDDKGTILACNSSGSFITGKEARSLKGKTFKHLFKGVKAFAEGSKKALTPDFFENICKEGKNLYNHTIGVTNKSHHTNWYNVNAQPISPFGGSQTFNMLISFNNITEKVLAQNVVKEQQVKIMEGSKLRTIGEMAGGIAHEIDNPLATIFATTERLDWKAEKEGFVEGETIQKSTGKVLKTVERISAIVKSLLALSREEEVDHQFVSIQDILDITFDLANIELSKNHVDFKIDSEFLSESIQCFPTQIAQVLLNLTKNSIDAIDALDEKWIKLKIEDGGDHFVFTHTDSGSGIPKEVAGKITQPFFTTKAIGKGTGLGLSISRNIITAHGGELRLDEEAKNTTFVFNLPKKFNKKETEEESVELKEVA